jgi:hypothetical protein
MGGASVVNAHDVHRCIDSEIEFRAFHIGFSPIVTVKTDLVTKLKRFHIRYIPIFSFRQFIHYEMSINYASLFILQVGLLMVTPIMLTGIMVFWNYAGILKPESSKLVSISAFHIGFSPIVTLRFYLVTKLQRFYVKWIKIISLWLFFH